jgi:hypothetical protein
LSSVSNISTIHTAFLSTYKITIHATIDSTIDSTNIDSNQSFKFAFYPTLKLAIKPAFLYAYSTILSTYWNALYDTVIAA